MCQFETRLLPLWISSSLLLWAPWSHTYYTGWLTFCPLQSSANDTLGDTGGCSRWLSHCWPLEPGSLPRASTGPGKKHVDWQPGISEMRRIDHWLQLVPHHPTRGNGHTFCDFSFNIYPHCKFLYFNSITNFVINHPSTFCPSRCKNHAYFFVNIA